MNIWDSFQLAGHLLLDQSRSAATPNWFKNELGMSRVAQYFSQTVVGDVHYTHGR